MVESAFSRKRSKNYEKKSSNGMAGAANPVGVQKIFMCITWFSEANSATTSKRIS